MAKGYWCKRSRGILAIGKSPYAFDKLAPSLTTRGTNKVNKEYFVPQWECTDDFKEKNIPCEFDLDNDVLDQLVANVDFNSDIEDQSLNRQLKMARKQKILKETKLIGERLQQRKKELFYNWSERFFDCFSDHFGKLKNALIAMHLNEEQVKTFNQTLQKCLQNMQIDLNSIWDEFKKEEQQNESI